MGGDCAATLRALRKSWVRVPRKLSGDCNERQWRLGKPAPSCVRGMDMPVQPTGFMPDVWAGRMFR